MTADAASTARAGSISVPGATARIGHGTSEPVRRGIESEADLAAALVDESREAVGEVGATELSTPRPLTFFLSPEPAEKRGTFPPGMKIRSPVRGFTPWRGPRSATANLPKPVKFTSPPSLRTSVIASRTASTAAPASFLFPIR